MQEKTTITLPKLGESILRATVVQWFKEEGEYIQLDEPLVEVLTDKVNSEIPSSYSGYIEEILAPPFVEIEVGAPLCTIRLEKKIEVNTPTESKPLTPEQSSLSSSFISPVVLQIARENNVDLKNLQEIKGTGVGGRISKKDIEQYLSIQKKPLAKDPLVPVSERRRAIARNLLDSYTKIPHASLMREIDVTEATRLIQNNKQQFHEHYGYKLTITSYMIQGIVQALQKYPRLNASWLEHGIQIHRAINLGIAVNIDDDLLVPVIMNCQSLSLYEIAGRVAELREKAKNNRLSVTEMQEGTVTVTNFGMGGAEIGIPIIRYPEAAIIGIGAITKRVVVFPNNSIGIAEKMFLSISFDHRIIDGMYASGFLQELKTYIENPENLHKNLPTACFAR